MSREPSPLLWLAVKVDEVGYSLYAAAILVEILILWLQYT